MSTITTPNGKDHRIGLAIFIDNVRYAASVQHTGTGTQIRMDRIDHKNTDTGRRTYTVDYDHEHESCSCADFVYRHQGRGTRCKHLLGLAVYSLVPKEIPGPKNLGKAEKEFSRASH